MPDARRSSLLRRSPAFGRLAASEVVSPLGDAMGTVALVFHLQRVQGTGTAVAAVLVAESLPPLLSPWLGVIADRVPARRLLVWCALAQAAVTAVASAWLPGLVALFGLVLVRATFASVAAPAVGAVVPALVDDGDLPAANSMLGGGRELGTIFGPALAGVLFAWIGARGVLAIDAATFLLAVPLYLGLPRAGAGSGAVAAGSQPAPAPAPETTVGADALAGLRHLWHTPVLRALALGFWLSVLATAADDLLLVFLATESLGAGPVGAGVLLAAASVGLVAGLVAIARWGRRIPAMTAILVGFVVMAGGNLATAAAPVLAVAFGLQVVRGIGIALLDVNVRTFVQRNVERAMLGRVLANLYGGVSVAAAIGYVIGGPLLDATSPRTMFVVIGVGGLFAAGVAAALVRGRDEGAP